MADETDAIFDDERANAIFGAIFEKTPDGSFDRERDWQIASDALHELMALGYSKDAANTFLNENFDCCEPA